MGTTTEEIILVYKADISNLEKNYDKVETHERALAASGKAAMGTIENGAKKASAATQQVSKNTTELKGKLTDLGNNLPFAQQAQQAAGLASAVLGIGDASKKASIGAQILKVALLSTGIPILIASVVALIAYFKRTDEGATRLAGVMAAFEATIDLVTGSVIAFGEAAFKAGRSFEDFGSFILEIATNIGGYILNRALAPVFLLKDGFDALVLAIKGDGTAAFEELKNGVAQFLSGFENLATKTDDFIKKAQAAAAAAYEWEKRMDALQDKIRSDSLAIAENDAAITKLIISSKNKITQDEVDLANIDEATRLEKQNLAITLQNEEAKLALIREKNQRERESINQDKKNLTDELKREETTAKRKIEILGELRSINDSFAEEEIAQQIKIIQIKQSSDNLLEKVQNRRDAKEEEIFQNQIKRIAQEETIQENAAKQLYVQGTTSAQELEDALYQIKLSGLNNQKELLVSQSRDIVDIDKAILDLELANLDKHNKERAALEKQQREAREKAEKEEAERIKSFRDAEAKYDEEQKKLREEAEKKHQANLNTIRSAAVDVAETLASGLYNNANQKRQNDLSAELDATQLKANSATAVLQDKLDKELITQEEFNAKKAVIDRELAAKESEIKRKQFQQEKKAALINIAINTAAAVVKTLATLGIPQGLLGSAVAIALGAAQAAVVSAQPTPKFKAGVIDLKGKGTGTSDSIDAKLSKGESVMTAEETKLYRGPLQAMRDRKYDQYIKKKNVVPELEKMQREAVSLRAAKESAAQNYLKLIANNNVDTSAMERQLRKNKKVSVDNIDELAKAMNKQSFYNSFG